MNQEKLKRLNEEVFRKEFELDDNITVVFTGLDLSQDVPPLNIEYLGNNIQVGVEVFCGQVKHSEEPFRRGLIEKHAYLKAEMMIKKGDNAGCEEYLLGAHDEKKVTVSMHNAINERYRTNPFCKAVVAMDYFVLHGVRAKGYIETILRFIDREQRLDSFRDYIIDKIKGAEEVQGRREAAAKAEAAKPKPEPEPPKPEAKPEVKEEVEGKPEGDESFASGIDKLAKLFGEGDEDK